MPMPRPSPCFYVSVLMTSALIRVCARIYWFVVVVGPTIRPARFSTLTSAKYSSVTGPGSPPAQLERAVKDGILVPWRKSEPEAFKTTLQLLTVDKGGVTYQPKVGAFEGVAEIDFASTYPALMTVHNISPETVLCS